MTDGLQSWGETFGVRVDRVPGKMAGLLRCLKPIRTDWTLRSDGNYGSLRSMETRPEPRSTAYMRAWMLAVAAGADLEEVQLSDDELPQGYSAQHWRRMIQEHCPSARPTPRRKKKD